MQALIFAFQPSHDSAGGPAYGCYTPACHDPRY